MIDHTLLNPHSTKEDVIKLCREAAEYGFAAVCVNGGRAQLALDTLKELNGSSFTLCTALVVLI